MHHRDAAEAEGIQEMLEQEDLVPLRSPPRSPDTGEQAQATSGLNATPRVNVWSVEKQAPPDTPDVIFWRRVGVTAFVGSFIWWSHLLSVRSSDRVRLPSTYDPSAIASYFVLRPERVTIRTISIVCEVIQYLIGVQRDQLEYRLFGPNSLSYNQLYKEHLNEVRSSRMDESAVDASSHSTGALRLRESWTALTVGARKQLVRLVNILTTPLRKDDTYWVWRRQRRAVLLRQALERLGPAFVKLGQALATRPDIVGEAAARELQRLQDDLPHFSSAEALRFIRTELGAPANRVFDWISESPVAAASLGQVYKASLDGVDLAVKVQRPGIVERIALDFYVVRMLGELWMHTSWAPRTDVVEAIDEYACRLFEETDYIHEAENMRRFRQLYGSLPGIYVPEVYPEYSSAHVLTMEWVNGRRLIDETATVRREDIPLIKLGILCSLMQLMESGFLHADPHTGNLLVTEDGSRLVYLDYGLMSEVPQSVQLSIICAVVHLINREYEQLATDFFGLTLMRRDDLDIMLPEFADALREAFESDQNEQNPADFTLQGVVENLLRMTVRFPFVMPPYFLNNLRALAILEGLALNADPSFRIMDIVYPYVVRRLLTDPSPQLQSALQELVLTPFGEPRWDRVEQLLDDAARSAPSMALSSLDPRPIAVLEVAAQQAAEVARLRRTQQSEEEARATMSAYFRQSPPEALLVPNDHLDVATADLSTLHQHRDGLLTDHSGLALVEEERRMQMLITFMASPAGGFLRRALERQLADDWNDRVQAFLDNTERRFLPAVLRAHELPSDLSLQLQSPDPNANDTESVTEDMDSLSEGRTDLRATPQNGTIALHDKDDQSRPMNGLVTRRHRSGPRLTTATRENRRRLSQIVSHLKLRHWRALLGLAPVLLAFYLRVICTVAWRVVQRLGFDLGVLFVLGWQALRALRPLALAANIRWKPLPSKTSSGSRPAADVLSDVPERDDGKADPRRQASAAEHSVRGNGQVPHDVVSTETRTAATNGEVKATEAVTRRDGRGRSRSPLANWSSSGKRRNRRNQQNNADSDQADAGGGYVGHGDDN
jgi:predicted unusual protein kinase regulating ubiquinone biosynthesis (AarF/ABC1/UbiB family)